MSLVGSVVVWLILLAPVAIYSFTFGITISHSHTRWAEMGSAMSGIYGPLLSFLTILVLGQQFKLQRSSEKRAIDQIYFDKCRADFLRSVLKLESAFSKNKECGENVKVSFTQEFGWLLDAALHNSGTHVLAMQWLEDTPTLANEWISINALMAGLNSSAERSFQNELVWMKGRAAAEFGFATCVALDNLLIAAYRQQLFVNPKFSPRKTSP
ncbi:hypothetical protein [Xylophilus rhododendri]|uniref:hypothetical protein n=1 Tax=Xylophilus rhododendri TaxID=2697032 RepID=UPI001E5FE643|nr:hypothetical protein [Xylophilus rhododendri]